MRTLAAIAPAAKNPGGINLTRAAIAAAMTGSTSEARVWAEARWTAPAVAETIKAAVAASTTSTWSEASPGPAGDEFIASALAASALGLVLARGARRVEFRQKTVSPSSPVVAEWVGEQRSRPISETAIAFGSVEPHSLKSAIVCSRELLMVRNFETEQYLTAELVNAVARELDATAFGADPPDGRSPGSLLYGVTPLSVATVADAIMALVDEYAGGPGATFVMSPLSLGRLALIHGHADPASVAGYPIATTAAIGNQIALIDAAGLAFEMQASTIEKLEHVTVQMDDVPDSPAGASTSQISLWQHNLVALGASTWAGWTVARPGAVTVATLGNSPA